MMRTIRNIAASLVLIASATLGPAASAGYNHIEYKHYYWDSSRQAWVGESWFWCDGTIETFGMVTGEYNEEYIAPCD
jgi:hypothetical protein